MSEARPCPSTRQLDLRGLPAPQPMERILAELDALHPGTRLEALTPLYPAPLLPLLEQLGFHYRVYASTDGARIVICHTADRQLLQDLPHP